MRYFEKSAEDSTLTTALKIGIPAVAGLGTYALLRRGPKRKLFWGIDYEIPKGLKKLLYGDVKFVSSVKKIKKTPGTKNIYYSDKDWSVLRSKKMDVKYNVDQKTLSNVIQDKLVFANLPGVKEVSIPTKNLHSVLKKSGKVNTSKRFHKALQSLPEDQYVKPRWGFANAGHFSSKDIKKLKPESKRFKQLYESTVNEGYVIQPKAQFRAITSSANKEAIGKPASEVRAHFAIENGKISPVGPAIKRWEEGKIPVVGKILKPSEAPSVSEIQKTVATIVRKNPQHFKGRNFVLGVDAFRDIKGKTKIFEVNDQSGFMHNPAVVNSFYKKVMGKENIPPAILKSVGVAGATGGATYGVTEAVKGKSTKVNKKTNRRYKSK